MMLKPSLPDARTVNSTILNCLSASAELMLVYLLMLQLTLALIAQVKSWLSIGQGQHIQHTYRQKGGCKACTSQLPVAPV